MIVVLAERKNTVLFNLLNGKDEWSTISEKSSSNENKLTWNTTPSRFSNNLNIIKTPDCPKKKYLSGYLSQKYVKRKQSRNFPQEELIQNKTIQADGVYNTMSTLQYSPTKPKRDLYKRRTSFINDTPTKSKLSKMFNNPSEYRKASM